MIMSVTDFREYKAAFVYQNDLMHYGVKGMKWGVRRYQNKDGSLTSEGRTHYGIKEQPTDKYIPAPAIAIGAMWIAEVALIGGVAVAETAVQAHKEKKLYKEEDNPNQLSRKALKKVNPKFGNAGYTENCSKCSVVTELASRGITEYTAGKGNGLPRDMHTKMFKGAKEVKVDVGTKTSLLKHFDKFPNGASGSYGFSYPNGMSGHSIHWTKLKNGQIRFEDGQTGKTYNMDDFFKHYNPAEARSSSIIRLDNCKPNYDILEQYEVLEKKKK